MNVAPEQIRRIGQYVAKGLFYGILGWISIALFAFGLSLLRYDGSKQVTKGIVLNGHIVSRWSWGLGHFGDVCFTVSDGSKWCAKQDYIRPEKEGGPGNIYKYLKSGTRVFIKGFAGYPAELVVNGRTGPESKVLLEYGYALPKIERDMKSASGGFFWIILGVTLIPGTIAVRRYGWPWLRDKLQDGLNKKGEAGT